MVFTIKGIETEFYLSLSAKKRCRKLYQNNNYLSTCNTSYDLIELYYECPPKLCLWFDEMCANQKKVYNSNLCVQNPFAYECLR